MRSFKNAEPLHNVPILDRAFHYGDGIFTTARFHRDILELEERHWLRLKSGAERLFLNFDFALIFKSIEQLRSEFQRLNGTLKIIISRGEGDRGYAIPDHPADVYVLFYPKSEAEHQIEIIESGLLSQVIGLSMPSLAGLKSLNRLEQVLLKNEALTHGWQEALVSDVQSVIVEGVSSNCFIKINKQWITPDLRYNGVHGVMRAEILSRMQQANIDCQQRLIKTDELKCIESLFFCNALSPMKAVQKIGHHLLDIQPCTALFRTLQLDQLSHYANSET
nr:aminodeoxychorismate lyase [Acinetobacter sp. Marseille-Q1620]